MISLMCFTHITKGQGEIDHMIKELNQNNKNIIQLRKYYKIVQVILKLKIQITI